MRGRQILLYFAWSRPAETGAPLAVIDDRFPAIFELRRLFYPQFERLSDGDKADQGIAGFLDLIQKPNFQAFAEQTEALTGRKVIQIERLNDAGTMTPLDVALDGVDSIVIISFDSLRTAQRASTAEVEAVRHFLDNPDHLIFVCPHHDIGEAGGMVEEGRFERQLAEYRHHGDHAIPPRQGFGGFARTLLAGLGVPVENRFGLRPAAPPHPFTQAGRSSFDALLQSRPDTFAGKLLVCDTTMFSSTAGGVENLRRFWANVVLRPEAFPASIA